jgi:hypothetical protein
VCSCSIIETLCSILQLSERRSKCRKPPTVRRLTTSLGVSPLHSTSHHFTRRVTTSLYDSPLHSASHHFTRRLTTLFDMSPLHSTCHHFTRRLTTSLDASPRHSTSHYVTLFHSSGRRHCSAFFSCCWKCYPVSSQSRLATREFHGSVQNCAKCQRETANPIVDTFLHTIKSTQQNYTVRLENSDSTLMPKPIFCQ